MATLDEPIQRPPALIPENPPTATNLIAHIDGWIIFHLKATISSNVHFENQLYGSVASFLASIFLSRRRFMTIPQAILRRAMEAEEVDEYLANVSFGSTGALHESRDLPGVEAGKLVPDFLTVKVSPQMGGVRDHYIVCIVEIKRNDVTEGKAKIQMKEYLLQAAAHPSRDENLRGYLVMANIVIPFRVEVHRNRVIVVEGAPFDMFATGDRFTRELCGIAIRHWNT